MGTFLRFLLYFVVAESSYLRYRGYNRYGYDNEDGYDLYDEEEIRDLIRQWRFQQRFHGFNDLSRERYLWPDLFRRWFGSHSSKPFKLLGSHPSVKYSETVAKHAMYLAYSAYCEKRDLESNVRACKCMNHVPQFKVDTVAHPDVLQAFTGFDPQHDQIVIAFRGTASKSKLDWLYDMDIGKTRYPGVEHGMVFRGFYNGWKKLKKRIMPSLKHLMTQHKDKKILITGHSLGAALAQFCAMDVVRWAKHEGYNMNRKGHGVYLYTFGSPRWGNKYMANYFNSLVDTHYRVVNKQDVVAVVPPKDVWFFPKYRHTGTAIWYTKDHPLTYKQCDGSGDDPKCVSGASLLKLVTGKRDHMSYLGVNPSCS